MMEPQMSILGPSINLVFISVSDLVVASPVEDYFLYIDDLTYPEKVEFLYFPLPFYIKR